MTTDSEDSEDVTHHGSCHCRAVKFSFQSPKKGVKITLCNRSIYDMQQGYVVWTVLFEMGQGGGLQSLTAFAVDATD
jgi:hypothetical protein